MDVEKAYDMFDWKVMGVYEGAQRRKILYWFSLDSLRVSFECRQK